MSKKDRPCHGCTKRWAANGRTCHSSCPEYAKDHEDDVERNKALRKKKADEAMIDDTHIKSIKRCTKGRIKQTLWKG